MLNSDDVQLRFLQFTPGLIVLKGHAELTDHFLKYKQINGENKRVILLYGSTGTGKSSFLRLTAAKWCVLSGKPVHIVTPTYKEQRPGYKPTCELLEKLIKFIHMTNGNT
jgi:ABC-type uncharacterized transport system fused permease/ATPase subunit